MHSDVRGHHQEHDQDGGLTRRQLHVGVAHGLDACLVRAAAKRPTWA